MLTEYDTRQTITTRLPTITVRHIIIGYACTEMDMTSIPLEMLSIVHIIYQYLVLSTPCEDFIYNKG